MWISKKEYNSLRHSMRWLDIKIEGGRFLTEDEYQEYLMLKDEKGHRWITNTEELEFANLRKWYKLSKQGNLITDAELKEYQDLKKNSKTCTQWMEWLNKEVDHVIVSKEEYEFLKKFKADCDKDIEEWDKGIQLEYNLEKDDVCDSCKQEWDKGYTNNFYMRNYRPWCDQETLEDIHEDEHGDIRTFIKDQKVLNRIQNQRITDLEK